MMPSVTPVSNWGVGGGGAVCAVWCIILFCCWEKKNWLQSVWGH